MKTGFCIIEQQIKLGLIKMASNIFIEPITQENYFLYFCGLLYHYSFYSFAILCLYGETLSSRMLLWLSAVAEVTMKAWSSSLEVNGLPSQNTVNPERKYRLRKRIYKPIHYSY
jgi:hypothetical protein